MSAREVEKLLQGDYIPTLQVKRGKPSNPGHNLQVGAKVIYEDSPCTIHRINGTGSVTVMWSDGSMTVNIDPWLVQVDDGSVKPSKRQKTAGEDCSIQFTDGELLPPTFKAQSTATQGIILHATTRATRR